MVNLQYKDVVISMVTSRKGKKSSGIHVQNCRAPVSQDLLQLRGAVGTHSQPCPSLDAQSHGHLSRDSVDACLSLCLCLSIDKGMQDTHTSVSAACL